MRKYIYSLLILSSFSLLSCNESTATFTKQYYEIGGLINKLISENVSNKPTFKKTLWVNDKEEVVVLKNINWEKELEVFLLADINKKDYLNKFYKDSTNNSITYTLKPNESAQVSSVKILFSGKTPKALIAKLLTDNFLYNSERTLEMNFVNNSLQSYSVIGWQKLLIGDIKKYRLQAVKI